MAEGYHGTAREHGTRKGYQQHRRSDRAACRPCKDANNAWARNRRAEASGRARCVPGLGWPLEPAWWQTGPGTA